MAAYFVQDIETSYYPDALAAQAGVVDGSGRSSAT